MNRRTFLKLTAGSAWVGSGRTLRAAGRRRPHSARRKILFICVDGFGPDYLRQSDMPNLKRMMRSGAYIEGKGVIPSVTNVNNSSIVTASFPQDHGITGNYYFDRARGKGYYMESADFLLRPTLFERAKRRELRSALVTSKEKLKRLLSRGTDLSVSAENPSGDLVEMIGPKKDIYSAAINYWSFRAARQLLRHRGFDLVYLATTDYMMHTYPPEHERSQEHLSTLDRLLGEILSDHSNLEVYVTADHGMSAKSTAIDLGQLLASEGIQSEAVPIIKDRYVAHHRNLGGACYVYLKSSKDFREATTLLRQTKGVDEVYRNSEAAEKFRLHPERIGDLFVLGAKHVVFGNLKKLREDVQIRSHGSRHESTVPIICYGRKVDPSRYGMNLDLTRNLDWF